MKVTWERFLTKCAVPLEALEVGQTFEQYGELFIKVCLSDVFVSEDKSLQPALRVGDYSVLYMEKETMVFLVQSELNARSYR